MASKDYWRFDSTDEESFRIVFHARHRLDTPATKNSRDNQFGPLPKKKTAAIEVLPIPPTNCRPASTSGGVTCWVSRFLDMPEAVRLAEGVAGS